MEAQGASRLVTTCKGRVWEDPTVYGINKRAAHVELNNFQSVHDGVKYVSQIGRGIGAEALKGGKKVLNGKWQFKLFPNPDHVPCDFIQGEKDDMWTQVRCPVYLHCMHSCRCSPPNNRKADPFCATSSSVPVSRVDFLHTIAPEVALEAHYNNLGPSSCSGAVLGQAGWMLLAPFVH